MRVLVCGDREFDDWELLSEVLEPYFFEPNSHFITGKAPGADFLVRVYLKYMLLYPKNISKYLTEYPADWKKYGNSAGPIRNQQMLDEGKPDLVVAFPGGKGTANMVKLAEEAGVKVIRIDSESKALSS